MSHKRLLVFVVAAGLLVVGLGAATMAQQSDTERIAVSELKNKLDSGETFLLIDVREDSELEENGAIKGAIHIPMGRTGRPYGGYPQGYRTGLLLSGRWARVARRYEVCRRRLQLRQVLRYPRLEE